MRGPQHCWKIHFYIITSARIHFEFRRAQWQHYDSLMSLSVCRWVEALSSIADKNGIKSQGRIRKGILKIAGKGDSLNDDDDDGTNGRRARGTAITACGRGGAAATASPPPLSPQAAEINGPLLSSLLLLVLVRPREAPLTLEIDASIVLEQLQRRSGGSTLLHSHSLGPQRLFNITSRSQRNPEGGA